MCGYASFSQKSTEITRRRRSILDSQSSVQSPLRQVSDGAINRCCAYSTMTRPEQRAYGKPCYYLNPKFMYTSRIQFVIELNL